MASTLASGPAQANPDPDAALDPSFGDDGVSLFDVGGNGTNSLESARDSQGRWVFTYRLDGHAAVGWLDPDGQDFDLALLDAPVFLKDVAVDSADRVVVVGGVGDSVNRSDVFLARFTTTGDLDPTFGDAGVVQTDFGAIDMGLSVAFDGDAVVVAGNSYVLGRYDVIAARYTATGSLDPSFGTAGKVSGVFPGSGFAEVAVDPQHRVFLGVHSRFQVARLLSTGALDTTYGSGGITVSPDLGTSRGFALQPDGRALLAGSTAVGSFALARFDASGRLDQSFGGGGTVITSVGVRGGASAESLAIGLDGKVVAAGTTAVEGGSGLAVARYLPNGTPDSAFGDNGQVVTDVGIDAFATSVFIDPGGRVSAAGFWGNYVSSPTQYGPVFARYAANTPAPPPPPLVSPPVVLTPGPPASLCPPAPTTPRSGYWMLGAVGNVYSFGDAAMKGEPAGLAASNIASSPTGNGYWVVGRDGRVFSYGDACFFGGHPDLRPGEIVSAISPTPTGNGYWLFTDQGRVFAYGSAMNFGDLGTQRLNGPVLGAVATPSGKGYYMVASDGGIFAFGDAQFHGSMGGARLNAPVTGLAPDPDGVGYWLVARDGGIFAFDARFRGSMGATRLNKPVVGMVAYGDGYLMVASDGGIFSFSSKPFVGSLGANPPPQPVIAVASINR
ncbi:MAG: hypothetical protein ACRDZW_07785 [Acidimicrobiales bacterium]